MKSAGYITGVLVFFILVSSLAGNPVQETRTEVPPSFEDAVALYYNGEFEEALAAFQKRVEYDTSDTRSRLQLSRLLREAGKMQEAREHLLILDASSAGGDYTLDIIKTGLLAGSNPGALPEIPTTDSAEELFWYGLWMLRRGNFENSEALLKESLQKNSRNPGAGYFLGILAQKRGDHNSAAEHFRLALKLEPNLTRALLPLARTEIVLGEVDAAYRHLRQALAVFPDNLDAAREAKTLTDRYPALAATKESDAEKRRIAIRAPEKKHLPRNRENLPEVRIGLAENTDILHMKTGGTYSLDSMKMRYQGDSDEILSITHSSGRMIVTNSAGTRIMETQEPILLTYDSSGATTALFDMQYGSGYYFAGSEDRFYRGRMEFSPSAQGITVVNQLNLEEYLYSVVPSEIPAYWPEEALTAQAIAARSYTLANMGRFSNRGFDLMGSVRSASYRGAGNEAERTNAAVDASQGQVLTYDGKILNAVYSANSGGHTESGESVWGNPSPLQAVSDPELSTRTSPLPPEDLARWLAETPASFSSKPGLHSASAYRWRTWVSAEEISARLRSRGTELGQIISLLSKGRGISGRVEKILVRGTLGSSEIRGDAIRSVLGSLRSNLFVSEPLLGSGKLPESFIFSGGGWGHGVGMDQSGAAGMASDGWTAAEILAHYYPGTAIETLYSGMQAPN